MAKATKLKMNDGFEIPVLGLGTYAVRISCISLIKICLNL